LLQRGYRSHGLAASGLSHNISVSAIDDCRFKLLGGDPIDGPRHIWWNFVSYSRERIEQAKADWQAGRFDRVIDDNEYIPLPEK
jgi:redox-sensitive bicupin YhaK (pirin superfamily)